MRPYYSDELVTLYHGDCLGDARAWIEADVLVTDPPYGIEYRSGWASDDRAHPIANDGDTRARDQVLAEWGDRPAIVFGTWRMPKPSRTRQTGIWDKGNSPGMGDLQLPWGPSFEEFYILGSGFVGKRGSAVIRAKAPPVNNRPNHPTPKPVGLMEVLLGNTLGTIADPFAGSGSTLLAARNLGRKCVAVEIEERYCELIAQRLSDTPMSLLDALPATD